MESLTLPAVGQMNIGDGCQLFRSAILPQVAKTANKLPTFSVEHAQQLRSLSLLPLHTYKSAGFPHSLSLMSISPTLGIQRLA